MAGRPLDAGIKGRRRPTERLVRSGSAEATAPAQVPNRCFSPLLQYRRRPGNGSDIHTRSILDVHRLGGRDTFAISRIERAPLNQLTELLGRMQAGDSGARDALFAAAYADL